MSEFENTLTAGDCIRGMNSLPAGCIDLTFADPPFNIGYDYDVYDDSLECERYLAWSAEWIAAVHRVLKPNGTFWLAIGDEYAAELKIESQRLGFHCRSWVIWYYTFGVHCFKKFTRSHAHLFHFVKDPKDFTFRDEAVRVPSARELVYNDKRANPAGRMPDDTWLIPPSEADCGLRNAECGLEARSEVDRQGSGLTGDHRSEDHSPLTTHPPKKAESGKRKAVSRSTINHQPSTPPPLTGTDRRLVRHSPPATFTLRPQDLPHSFQPDENTWYFPRVAGTFKERAGFHGCQMPEQLLGRIIRACSHPGELVLDPFSGSATTLAVAKKLGRRYAGFDVSADYVEYGRNRLDSIRPGDALDGSPEPLKSAPRTGERPTPAKR